MGLFEKKFCDICSDKIGILGNRKLENGNLCGKCAKLLSPFFGERRRSTVEDIKNQLAYREENKKAVAAFNTTRALGRGTKVLLDEDKGKFIVSAARKLEDENPDVINFSQVTGCNIDINENKTEQKQKDAEGKSVSYNPQRFTFSYDFNIIINVNTPWFNEIRFRLNSSTIKIEPPPDVNGQEFARRNTEYLEHDALAREIRDVLTQVRQNVRDNAAAANTPKTAQKCTQCGATSIPDDHGRCEYCGGALA